MKDRVKEAGVECDHEAQRGEACADGAALPVRRGVVCVLSDFAVAHLHRAGITMTGTAGELHGTRSCATFYASNLAARGVAAIMDIGG